jgi:hypothetical protein
MKALHKLKIWYTFNDAIKRISEGINEELNPHDLIQFLVYHKLPVCWYLSDALGVEIKKERRLLQKKSQFFQKTIVMNENGKLVEKDLSDTEIELEDYFKQQEYVQYLNGFYKFDMSQKLITDWFMSIFAKKGKQPDFSFDGIRLIAENGMKYELVERTMSEDALDNDHEAMHPVMLNALLLVNEMIEKKGGIKQKDERNFFHLSNFHPCIEFPYFTDIYLKNIEIEAFILAYKKMNDESLPSAEDYEKPKTEKEKNNDLKIIGALLNTTIKRGEKHKKSLFSSQSEIISELLELYPNVSGLSKRNLEARFATAKRLLEEE